MTISEIHQQIEEYILQAVPAAERDDLEKAILHFHVQPNGSVLSGDYYLNGKRHPLDVRDKDKVRPVTALLRQLHEITTLNGTDKWNKGHFTASPGRTLETQYEWDQEWQDEEDGAEAEAQNKDPHLVLSKWHWEK